MPSSTRRDSAAPIERVEVSAYTVPTDQPESDGTFAWTSTTLLLVEPMAGGQRGLGYTYAAAAGAALIRDALVPLLVGEDAWDLPARMASLLRRVRNMGSGGLAARALSAVDTALWDLKAKLLGVPLARLFGQSRPAAPLYGSGGFTSYTDRQLQTQLTGWADAGIPRVKMKVGTHADADPARVRRAREALGPGPALFVDANGAYTVKQALALARDFREAGVSWFEEPVSSDDLTGLRRVRDGGPAGLDVAAGEYGDSASYFRRMLEAGAVDVLQADASRCLGFTGFLQADALADAFHVPLSAHCAPALHLHVACAARRLVHVEYFHDHARLERMLFDGVPQPVHGALAPDLSRPGLGLELKRADAARFAVGTSA
ncbi:mandelate racemase [Corallococcus exercitus]|uniref:enolase C-terminal domain-like protein n=1 Tax=Corallococcus exercitus TaxID=2316736 RepID=UPI000EA29CCB|nr:enolase C-terminal domain-like protein [Corallococcus exercitus]RKG81808.1 mandelate racemase [Corallococcus exercitus]